MVRSKNMQIYICIIMIFFAASAHGEQTSAIEYSGSGFYTVAAGKMLGGPAPMFRTTIAPALFLTMLKRAFTMAATACSGCRILNWDCREVRRTIALR